MKLFRVAVFCVGFMTLAGVASAEEFFNTARPCLNEKPGRYINDPAKYCCIKFHGRIVNVQGEGGQYGVCIFRDNSYCGQWDFAYNRCNVGGSQWPGALPLFRGNTSIPGFCVVKKNPVTVVQGKFTDGICRPVKPAR